MLNILDSQSGGNQVFLLTSADQTKEVVSYIKGINLKNPREEIVLGMDCEGLHVNKPLSLLQVSHISELTQTIIDAL